MDINDPRVAQALISMMDARIEKILPALLARQKHWDAGKVATTGSGPTISVYINNSTTAVDVKNPRSFSLTAGQSVVLVHPNFKQDNMTYIDRT